MIMYIGESASGRISVRIWEVGGGVVRKLEEEGYLKNHRQEAP